MAFTAREVIQTAQFTLQDANGIRWTPPELLEYLNSGAREIALQKPTATSETTEFSLSAGTRQSLPAGYHRLLSVIRNGTGDDRAVTPVAREILDMQFPGWHSTSVIPFSATVLYVIDDPSEPSVFHVCPGNDGTGELVAVLSKLPTPIVAPANSILDVTTYSTEVDLPDIYRNCLVDYVCYRAFSKDLNLAGAAQRAQAHYQLFQAALGLKAQADMTKTIDTPQSRFSQ